MKVAVTPVSSGVGFAWWTNFSRIRMRRMRENFIGRTDDNARETQNFLAVVGNHDTRAIPLEQLHAQILLELPHLNTEGWLGNGAAIGRP
jgi:hypothetical protein